ncbi:MAG TPA: cytochrome c [Acetobacteraceae bacterium]|nr:cytochrome c [Acetobacteraceae bacterium]
MALAGAGIARAEGFDVIETRQAGQDLLITDFGGMRAVLAAKGDVKTLENTAKAMARWERQFVSLFPPGSDTGHNTHALPVVWSDRAGFQKASDDLSNSLDKLAELAKAGDTDGVNAQMKVVGEACAACHRTYRAR